MRSASGAAATDRKASRADFPTADLKSKVFFFIPPMIYGQNKGLRVSPISSEDDKIRFATVEKRSTGN